MNALMGLITALSIPLMILNILGIVAGIWLAILGEWGTIGYGIAAFVVSSFAAERGQFYLPSYSPELNPDEYLNCDMKAAVHSGLPARNENELKTKVISHMRKLQKLPKRIAKYFKHPRINYAA